MLKDLFKLLVSCVSEPAETISRVGCSCIRSDALGQLISALLCIFILKYMLKKIQI